MGGHGRGAGSGKINVGRAVGTSGKYEIPLPLQCRHRTASPLEPTRPASEAMLMMLPERRATMRGNTA